MYKNLIKNFFGQSSFFFLSMRHLVDHTAYSFIVIHKLLFKLKYHKRKDRGLEPWSSGYGRRLMFERSWVRSRPRILDGHDIFSHWFVVKIVLLVWKRPKINKKRPVFFKKKDKPGSSSSIRDWIRAAYKRDPLRPSSKSSRRRRNPFQKSFQELVTESEWPDVFN